jgi:hypothetical protein
MYHYLVNVLSLFAGAVHNRPVLLLRPGYSVEHGAIDLFTWFELQ